MTTAVAAPDSTAAPAFSDSGTGWIPSAAGCVSSPCRRGYHGGGRAPTPDDHPVTPGIYQYLGAYVSNWSSVMAAAVLASVPALVLLVVAQRFVAAGLSDGAVR